MEEEYLKILEDAISDVGAWTWWTEKFPEAFQIEFVGTQLWNPPLKESEPPSAKIALCFLAPKSVSFLIRKNAAGSIDNNWPELLQQDIIDYFYLSYDSFTFNDDQLTEKILEEAETIDTVFGLDPKNTGFNTLNYRLAFWAGEVGLIVGAEHLKIFNHSGEVHPVKIEEMNKKWWEYWEKYWELKDTKNALPRDYTCEVTFPFASEGKE